MDCTFEEEKSFLVFNVFTLKVPDHLGKNIKDYATSPELTLGVRPEDILIYKEQMPAVEPLGSETIVDLKLGDELVKARISPTFEVYPGKKAWIKFNIDRIHIN